MPIVILGVLATIGAATRSGAAHNKHEPARQSDTSERPATSILESVVQHGNSSVLLVRAANSKLFQIMVPSGTSIATQNEGRTVAGGLRSGDRLVLKRDGRSQDISQRTVALSGVVAFAPMSNKDVMIVQITPSRTILVDVAPQTRFTDITREQTSPTDVVDADTVAIHGVLDITMDEIVIAQGIERLGPKVSRTYSSG